MLIEYHTIQDIFLRKNTEYILLQSNGTHQNLQIKVFVEICISK